MEKKLPGIYANKINKPITNNEKVAYGYKEKEQVEKKEDSKRSFQPEKNINQKLREIFASPRYVYKADVKIVTKNGNIVKKIIGQNNTHLITMDNELIPIGEITDISFVTDEKS